MKHVFTTIRKSKISDPGFPIEANSVEKKIEWLSRIAGPVALLSGYVGLYLLVRYLLY